MKKNAISISLLALLLILFNDNGNCEDAPYSLINIYVKNNTLKTTSPIEIRFNDSLVYSKAVYDNQAIRYKIHSQGNLKISALIRGYDMTKSNFSMNIVNGRDYVLIMNFDNANYPGCIYTLRKTDGTSYEEYYEENIFNSTNSALKNIDFETDPSNDMRSVSHSVHHLLFHNDTYSFQPIKLWFNDSLIMNLDILSFKSVYCKLFSEGTLKITAQLGDKTMTKTQQEFDVSNGDVNFIKICFMKKNKPGEITLLSNNEGSAQLSTFRNKWTVPDLYTSNSEFLSEQISNPIPKMLPNNAMSASLSEIYSKHDQDRLTVQSDSLKRQALDHYYSGLVRQAPVYELKNAHDLLILNNGDSMECQRFTKLYVENDKLMMDYVKEKRKTITTYIDFSKVDRIVIDIYNEPDISDKVYGNVLIDYMILDTALFNSIYSNLDNSPYWYEMKSQFDPLNEIAFRLGRITAMGGLGVSILGVYLVAVGQLVGIPVIVGGLGILVLGYIIAIRSNAVTSDGLYNEFLQKHQTDLTERRARIINNFQAIEELGSP